MAKRKVVKDSCSVSTASVGLWKFTMPGLGLQAGVAKIALLLHSGILTRDLNVGPLQKTVIHKGPSSGSTWVFRSVLSYIHSCKVKQHGGGEGAPQKIISPR